MRVVLACHAPRGSRSGNRRTAERWARLLRELGHEVRVIGNRGDPRRADVLIALHARHTAEAVSRSRARAPERPIVLALTGTDLSHDIHVDETAVRSLVLADRLVVLHDLAPREVPARYRAEVRVIRQSAHAPRARVAKAKGAFEVVVVGHLREVKDPLRTALASRLLAASSRVRVLHAGRALEDRFARAARREERENPRYTWLGELSPSRALRLIARAQLFVLSSRSEGGANVLAEAVMCGTPIVASRISAARAALGGDYPALFPVHDTRVLARLIARAENEPRWLVRLARRVRARRPLFDERAEKTAWCALLAEIASGRIARRRGRCVPALRGRGVRCRPND